MPRPLKIEIICEKSALIYLSRVRAGVVSHPVDWPLGGYMDFSADRSSGNRGERIFEVQSLSELLEG